MSREDGFKELFVRSGWVSHDAAQIQATGGRGYWWGITVRSDGAVFNPTIYDVDVLLSHTYASFAAISLRCLAIE